jgi:hypothetical protein
LNERIWTKKSQPLHAGIAAKASQRDKLEHLARYVSRPPVATERLSLTEGGLVRLALKTPYRDGTTHVIFEPEDFIARLVALVPKPRAHLTRYHGVFAPASPDRARVVPKTRVAAAGKAVESGEPSASDRQRSLSWAQRLKRAFAIDSVRFAISPESNGFWSTSATPRSRSIRPIRVGRRPRPIFWSDRFVVSGNLAPIGTTPLNCRLLMLDNSAGSASREDV